MQTEMARHHIPGASFVFVQNGHVIVQRGYGVANVTTRERADPVSTIWRVGSISKVFTATAVMQLVDRGAIALDSSIEHYVHRIPIPQTYSEPVTVRELLDHTAGFDEIRPGTQAPSRESVLPLDVFLRDRLVRVRPPGRTIAYSTYGITLAGELVEEVGGAPFESFLANNIWRPLGMASASINPESRRHVAIGYEISGDSVIAQPWEWYHTIPASSVNASAADMARFLIAHLERGVYNGARILSERSALEMQRQQVTMDPSIPGFALGFYEDYVGDIRVLEHGGQVAGFSSLMVLVPSERAGFFVVSHLENTPLHNDLKWTLLERFFPPARHRRAVPAVLPAPEKVKASRFAGTYIPMTSCFSCQPVRASSTIQVSANPDGTLRFAGNRWIAVDSLRFVQDKGTGSIVFRADSTGAISQVFAGGFWAWQKVQPE